MAMGKDPNGSKLQAEGWRFQLSEGGCELRRQWCRRFAEKLKGQVKTIRPTPAHRVCATAEVILGRTQLGPYHFG